MDDLISVIVPMYNTEAYLEKTLKSIVNQTYRNMEIILINDASTDRTADIAGSYAKKHHNIKLINQQNNKGVSAARNLGLKIAKGTYVTFVDSDDLLTKQALEIMYNTAKENSADLVFGVYKNLAPEGVRLPGIYKRFKSLTQKGRVLPFTNPEIFSHVYIFGKLYKKELIEGVSFPEGISYAEDQPFTMYVNLYAKKIYTAPSVVYYYREREQGESATQLALINPVKNLKSTFDSFNIGRKYFEEKFHKKDNYALLIYLSRVLEGSVKFIFEGAIQLKDQAILKNVISMLIQWIEKLDNYLVLGTDSFQTFFLENGQEYMKYFNIENQQLYIGLLRLIRDKKLAGSEDYKKEISEHNRVIELFLESIDEFLITNKIVKENNYAVCYPDVSHFNKLKGEATTYFRLVENERTSLVKVIMSKKNGSWAIANLIYEENVQIQTEKVENKRPKVLLIYRDFSGCNTLALYKSIPSYISERFDVDFISGNRMSIEYVRKVMESDIVVTTNMEYGFYKFHFDPNKIVIDLWHGFPLKNMFYEDPSYHDKNSIAPYWRQFNYLLSYSNLYSEVVGKCIKVNPGNFVVTGAPRNDLLYAAGSQKKLFDLLGKEDKGQKIIFYMPTFRLSDQKKGYEDLSNIFGFKEFDLDTFTVFLEENNFELIIKAHPIFGRDFEKTLKQSSCINLLQSNDLMNKGIDLYEVLGAVDLLITDYSSVYFDYLLLDKPIIFTPSDLEDYKLERGFVLEPYEKWTPGPKVINQIDLQNEIMYFENNINYYRELRRDVKDKVHFHKDANSSERVWQFISSLCDSDN